MDGYGLRDDAEGNAVRNAHTPNLDRMFSVSPTLRLRASDRTGRRPAVRTDGKQRVWPNQHRGRPCGLSGFPAHFPRLADEAPFSQTLPFLPSWSTAGRPVRRSICWAFFPTAAYTSHATHLYALLEMAGRYGLEQVFIHAFLDGRDVPPDSGAGHVAACARRNAADSCVGRIARCAADTTRMTANPRYERVARALRRDGSTAVSAMLEDPVKGVKESYAAGVTERNSSSRSICGRRRENNRWASAWIFFNFRPDRAREITRALVDPAFDGFSPANLAFSSCISLAPPSTNAAMPNVSRRFRVIPTPRS
jgi:2,3-bisphosphoglycerate-independent phosphoglycerate mutase